MSTRTNKTNTRNLTLDIPREKWSASLDTFSNQYQGSLIQLATHDRVTGEDVVSEETPLHSIALDMEDEKNPRINVIVELDNKLIKHILFRPSLLVLQSSNDGQEQSLRIQTVNTETTIHFRAPTQLPSALI